MAPAINNTSFSAKKKTNLVLVGANAYETTGRAQVKFLWPLQKKNQISLVGSIIHDTSYPRPQWSCSNFDGFVILEKSKWPNLKKYVFFYEWFWISGSKFSCLQILSPIRCRDRWNGFSVFWVIFVISVKNQISQVSFVIYDKILDIHFVIPDPIWNFGHPTWSHTNFYSKVPLKPTNASPFKKLDLVQYTRVRL